MRTLRRICVTILLLACGACQSSAWMLDVPRSDAWAAFPLRDATRTIAALKIDFAAENAALSNPYAPAGLLTFVAAPYDAYLACSWGASEPDRDDHFSAKWTGFWRNAPPDCEIRLRALGKASLSMDGAILLECDNNPVGVTRTLSIAPGSHSLYAEYAHTVGEALMLLEMREAGRAWVPLAPSTAKHKEPVEGWNGEYFLGSGFEKMAFSRIDKSLFFNWGKAGPFDRPEDLPTLSLRWRNENASFAGEIRSLRRGFAVIHPNAMPGARIHGDAVSARLSAPDGADCAILFNREIAWSRNGQPMPPPLEPIMLDPSNPITLSLPISREDPVLFREEKLAESPPSKTLNELRKAEKKFLENLPSAKFDQVAVSTELFIGGRAWTRWLYASLGAFATGERLAISPSTSRRRPYLADQIAARLPGEVSAMTKLCFPDLASLQPTNWRQIPSSEISSLLVGSPTADLERLWGLLYGADSQSEPEANSPIRWKTESPALGLAKALEAFSKIRMAIPEAAEDGFRNLNFKGGNAVWKLENWGGIQGEPINLTLSPSGVSLEAKNGTRLLFQAPIDIRKFQIDKQGRWQIEVKSDANEIPIEVGPKKLFREALWNGAALLMTQQGADNTFRGNLTSPEGTLSLRMTEKQGGIPRH